MGFLWLWLACEPFKVAVKFSLFTKGNRNLDVSVDGMKVMEITIIHIFQTSLWLFVDESVRFRCGHREFETAPSNVFLCVLAFEIVNFLAPDLLQPRKFLSQLHFSALFRNSFQGFGGMKSSSQVEEASFCEN